MSKKRGLGRGLGALIPQGEETSADDSSGGLRTVAIDAIVPNPHQPRSAMDEEALDELAASIEEHGLIQPLIVNDSGDENYTLIAGERRWRAARRAGLTHVPVVVKEASPQGMLELALIENIQRADLNPLEEAAAYRQLLDEFGLTQAQVAKRVGKSRPAVGNTVRLLELPEKVRQAVVSGEISGGHARAILRLSTEEMRLAMMNTIIRKGLSVRQTESLVRKWMSAARPKGRQAQRTPPELVSLESQFQQSLGTRVNITKGAKGGKVVIHFYSDEELNAIYEAIVKE
jgi:ParB family chromosome partitioning protein